MARLLLGLAAVAVVGYLLADWLTLSDRERVEDTVERLCDLARSGGEQAAAEILETLAEDYRADPPFDRGRIAAYLERYVAPGRVRRLTTGNFKVIWAGEELVVPLLRLDVEAGRRAGTLLLRVHFAERNGRWRIVQVSRWRFRSGSG